MKNKIMEADDFIAILIYLIIKAECLDIIPLLDVVTQFTLNKRQKKLDYLKASLEGSI